MHIAGQRSKRSKGPKSHLTDPSTHSATAPRTRPLNLSAQPPGIDTNEIALDLTGQKLKIDNDSNFQGMLDDDSSPKKQTD